MTAKGRATWSRRSVAVAVQALRAFFRYAERAHQCRAGIAAIIRGPRLYDLETLPSGPTWGDVEAIITGLATDRAVDIRRVAALLLFATYGFRVGEVAGLTLDDLDWEHEVIRIRRVKRHDVQTYPLSKEAGLALLRYITDVRPRGHWLIVYLARYLRGGPIKNHRLVAYTDTAVCFRYRDRRGGKPAKWRTMSLLVQESLDRLFEHGPVKGLHMVRAYGVYAGREHAALERCRSQLQPRWPQPPPQPALSRPEPERRPRCGAPLTVVVLHRAPFPPRRADEKPTGPGPPGFGVSN